MSRLATLPRIMLAPNGARRTKADHPALPITIAETVEAARAGFAAGARALHAHVRDKTGGHTLDAGLYKELIGEMARAVPDMPVQITTENVGRFTPDQQRAVVRSVRPEGVSIALSEMCPGAEIDADARRFYHWAAAEGIAVQHICYDPAGVTRLARAVSEGDIPAPIQCIYVFGRYVTGALGAPDMLPPFLAAAQAFDHPPDWALCSFGATETECLLAALRSGGKARIGFENNLIGPDGLPAPDNAARVADLMARIEADERAADPFQNA